MVSGSTKRTLRHLRELLTFLFHPYLFRRPSICCNSSILFSSVVCLSPPLVTFSLFYNGIPQQCTFSHPLACRRLLSPPTIFVLNVAARAPLQSQPSMQRYRPMHMRYISEGALSATYFPFAPSTLSFLCRCVSVTPTLFKNLSWTD